MNDYKELLNVIDSRNTVKEKVYLGKVTVVQSDNKKANVVIAGENTSFTFLNKTGEVLSIGDSVYIRSYGDNITNGYIDLRLGTPVWGWE